MTPLEPLQLEGLELRCVSGGRMWLDGGTMFGVIPKTLWQRKAVPDELNRVAFETRCLLVQCAGKTVLIDSGYGSNPPPRQREHQSLQAGHPLLENLARLDVEPEQIDLVILTHLHFDHVGGCTLEDKGRWRPTFPRARHLVQRAEWEDATANLPELAGNYPPHNFLPLADAGVIDFIDGDATILPGLAVRVSGGHTRGHQMLELGVGEKRALFLGDLCPTSAHLRTFWSMSYDQFPLTTRRVKPQVLADAARRRWPVIFEHDAQIAAALLAPDAKEEFILQQTLTI